MTVPTEYVRVVLVNDTARYAGFGDVQASEDDAIRLLQEANLAWLQGDLPRDIQFVVVAQETWTNGDPFTPDTASDGKTNVNSLLSQFSSWWQSNRQESGRAIGVLLTGRELQSDVLGFAGIGTVCTSFVTAVVRTTAPVNALAHMLGHTFGMRHDSVGNECPQSGFVMASVMDNGPTSVHFSTCSSNYLSDFFSSSAETAEPCFLRPLQRDALAPASWCGDGVVQPGEQCDCGVWCDVDPCCSGDACLLRDGATCSAGEGCCDMSRCQPHASDREFGHLRNRSGPQADAVSEDE